MNMNVEMLSSSIPIGRKRAPNRIVNQPMECNDGDASGSPTDLTFRRYRNLAEGKAGIIFFEALTISYESRARKNQLGISEDTARGLERLLKEMRKINGESLIFFQLDHSGSLSHPEFSKTVSMSPTGGEGIHVLSEKEIDHIGFKMAQAAVIAREVGADGIDFKHCHGYLCSEMIRPANTRPDRYGNSFDNRTRFFRETTQKIQDALRDKSFIIGTRYSVYEGIPGGFGTRGPGEVIEDLSESIAFAELIETLGMDYINVSAGIPAVTPEIVRPTKLYPEGVYRHFGWAKAVKEAVRIPVIGSGYSYLRDGKNRLKEPDPSKKDFIYWAEKNLRDGHADLVGIGRQSLADPLFAKKILNQEVDSINFCTACGGCSRLMKSQRQVGCTVFNEHYRETLDQIKREGQG